MLGSEWAAGTQCKEEAWRGLDRMQGIQRRHQEGSEGRKGGAASAAACRGVSPPAATCGSVTTACARRGLNRCTSRGGGARNRSGAACSKGGSQGRCSARVTASNLAASRNPARRRRGSPPLPPPATHASCRVLASSDMTRGRVFRPSTSVSVLRFGMEAAGALSDAVPLVSMRAVSRAQAVKDLRLAAARA